MVSQPDCRRTTLGLDQFFIRIEIKTLVTPAAWHSPLYDSVGVIHFFDKIKLCLYPQVRNFMTQPILLHSNSAHALMLGQVKSTSYRPNDTTKSKLHTVT